MANLVGSIFSNVANGATNLHKEKYSAEGRQRQQEEREAAKLRAAERAAAFQQTKVDTLTDEQVNLTQETTTQELKLLKQQQHQAMAENAKRTVYSAFDRYTGDHNTRHLNTALQELKSNPAGKRIFGDITRVDPITKEDTNLLVQKGLDPTLVLENEELRQQLIKTVKADGSVTIEDLGELFAMSGYHRYTSDREIERQRKVATIVSAFRNNGLKTETERSAHRQAVNEGLEPGTDEYNIRFQQIFSKLNTDDSTMNFSTKDEREAERLTLAAGVEKDSPEWEDTYNSNYHDIIARNRQTSDSRKMDEVEQTKIAIKDKASKLEQGSFFKINFADPNNFELKLEFEDEIQRIEKLGGLELDVQAKKDLSYIRQLIAVANTTEGISEAETGLIDRFSRGIKNYTTNNVDGLKAVAAYGAYRNTVRHALYGSALSGEEIKAFTQQFGTLGQQTGPVLAQFSVALTQLKAKLEGLASTNDSYVSHFRLGADQEQLAVILDSLDERIDFFNRAQAQFKSQATTLTPEEAAELDALFQSTGAEE